MASSATKVSYYSAINKIIGFVVMCGSILGLFKSIKICRDNENYKHMEYNKIISINYLIDRTVEPSGDGIEESEYWTIGCSYRLRPAMIRYKDIYETEVKVWIDHKFPTKKLATEHLYCAGEGIDINGIGNNGIFPLFYPTKGYTFNISLPGNDKNNKCLTSKNQNLDNRAKDMSAVDRVEGINGINGVDVMRHGTSIVFDRYSVYGMDSAEYYDGYMKERTYYLVTFVILLISSFIGICISGGCLLE